MSVLILEDNRQILNVLEELVMSVAEDEKVYATDNVGEAYKIAMETSIDVFLLDIILYTDKKGDTSGMQYAQSMRKLERYRFTPIIFITSLEDPEMYALRDLHAFGYIEKPFAPSQVENLLRDALHFKTQKEKDAMMFFRKDGILYPVKCNRVIYMELIKRKICIHMKNGDVLSIPYKSFREIMEEANYEKFVQCSRNCVINIDYIKNIDKTNRFITLEGTKTAVEMGGTFIKKRCWGAGIMIISLLYVVFEAIAVLLLLHTLYGKKICWNIYSIAFVVIDYILMLATKLFGVNQNLSVIIYIILIVYCFVEFKSTIKQMIINMILLAVIMMGIQLAALLILGLVENIISGHEDILLVITNLIIITVTIAIYKKVDLHKISISFEKNRNTVLVILLLESTLILFVIFEYKNAYGKVQEQYAVIGGILVFIVILCIHALLYKIKYQEKQAELEAYKTYSAAFSDLITQIRARQHEFDNHISALCNLHYICKDYDELVSEQSKYAKDVISNNRFHRLLVSGNPVIAGFLYGKLSSIQEQGIEVTYTFHISEFTSKIPVYLVVELIGNLLKNAVEAVKTQRG